MKGLEIVKKFYNEYGKDLIEENFGELSSRIAIGLVGEGSECFGYDDENSLDHDVDFNFCAFLSEKDYNEFGFRLERALSRLPKEFLGIKKNIVSPVGGNRRGVIVIEDFYARYLGKNFSPENLYSWFYAPSFAFAVATNGEVFRDDLGQFSAIRNKLKDGYPEDVRRKKISAHLISCAQSGQYNYDRCVKHGETGASQLAVFEFVKNAISLIYLLNNKYEPFYKWAYRGLRDLAILGELEIPLCALTETGNSKKQVVEKKEIIEDICSLISKELLLENLINCDGNDLEKHAYSVQATIRNNEIRNMNIFDGI